MAALDATVSCLTDIDIVVGTIIRSGCDEFSVLAVDGRIVVSSGCVCLAAALRGG